MSEPALLRGQAERCRRLAAGTTHELAIVKLQELAAEFEEEARRLEAAPRPEPPLSSS